MNFFQSLFTSGPYQLGGAKRPSNSSQFDIHQLTEGETDREAAPDWRAHRTGHRGPRTWIDQQLAAAARLRRVDSPTGAELVGRKSGDYSGSAIPYFVPGATEVREYRLRRDHPDMEISGQGGVKPKQKYLSPPDRGNMLYFAPGIAEAQLRDPVVVSGVSLARHRRQHCQS